MLLLCSSVIVVCLLHSATLVTSLSRAFKEKHSFALGKLGTISHFQTALYGQFKYHLIHCFCCKFLAQSSRPGKTEPTASLSKICQLGTALGASSTIFMFWGTVPFPIFIAHTYSYCILAIGPFHWTLFNQFHRHTRRAVLLICVSYRPKC